MGGVSGIGAEYCLGIISCSILFCRVLPCKLFIDRQAGRQAGTRGQYIVIDDINGTPYKPARLPCASETWTSLITSHVMRQSIHTPGTHTHTHTTAQQSNTNTNKQPSPSRHNDP